MQKYFPVFDSLKPGRTHRLVFLKSLFTFLLILDIIFARVVAFARRCLDDSQFKSRKQHHTAKRIYDQLVAERGFSGGETTVPTAAIMPRRNSVSLKAQDGPRRGFFPARAVFYYVGSVVPAVCKDQLRHLGLVDREEEVPSHLSYRNSPFPACFSW